MSLLAGNEKLLTGSGRNRFRHRDADTVYGDDPASLPATLASFGVAARTAPPALSSAALVAGGINNLFGASISLSGLTSADGFKLQGEAPAAGGSATQSGAVSNAGDVNGDGFDDLLVGAFGYSTSDPTRFTGAAYVVFGKASGFGQVNLGNLNGTNGFKLVGESDYDLAGGRVSSAGDVNGDGFADIMVSASGAGGAPSDTGGPGAVYIVFGKASGFGTVNLSNLGSGGFKIVGEATGDFVRSGSVASGDFNGDGYTDMLVGAGFSTGRAGAAYVVYGKQSGFGTVNLNNLGGSGFKISGEAGGDYLGRSVSSAGDVNGDGFDDIIVGGYGNSSGGRSDNGAAYVIFGKSSGLASMNVSALNGANGFKIVGQSNYDYAGYSVSSAGDINGDGFADIIIGMNDQYNGASSHAGAAYVVFGKASGFGATIDLNGLSASTGFKINGAAGNDYTGYAVSGAGDVNNDGYADFLVSADRASSNGANSGTVYLIFGKGSGLGTINLASLTAADGVKIIGEAAGDMVGRSVSRAGDVNNDGYDDLIVGSFGNDGGGTNAGAAYVIFGRSNVSNTPPTIATNTGSTVAEGGTDTITSGELTASDAQQGAASLTFTITSAATNGTLRLNNVAIGLNGTFTQADINAGLLTYVHNGGETTSATFGFAVSDGAGGTISGQTFTFTVTPVDDAPVAVNDAQTLDADQAATLSLTGNDTDVDGGPKTVVTIAGQTVVAGQQYQLASGALLVFNNDGSISFDPNGAYDYLVSAATAAASGASNTTATESFSYMLNGGSSATVTLTINGVDGPGDELRGTSAAETITGDANANVLIGYDGNDVLVGGGGGDRLVGGNGTDTADYSGARPGVRANLATGGTGGDAAGDTYDGIENLVGSAYADVLVGDAGDNTLIGAGRDDTLDGGAGADFLNGGKGIDTVTYATSGAGVEVNLTRRTGVGGTAQGDTFAGIENVIGSTFDDKIIGVAHLANVLSGGDGADDLTSRGSGDTLDGGAGDDRLYIDQSPALVAGGDGADRLYVAANAMVTFVDGSISGVEKVYVPDGASLDLSAVSIATGFLYATSTGGGGATIVGTAASDTISGGAGNDRLSGSGGDDVIILTSVGTGTGPSVDGGVGSGDELVLRGGGSYQFTDGNFSGFETVRVQEGSAADLSGVSSGLAIVIGDSQTGGTVIGTAGSDTITGGLGADRIVGGGGADTMRGYGGADVFVFDRLANLSDENGAIDTIGSFKTGEDKIDISQLGFDPAVGANAGHFVMIGTAAFTGAGGDDLEARIDVRGPSRAIVEFDVNHDGIADASIMVQGEIPQSSDFLL